jgi:hypothetical protein
MRHTFAFARLVSLVSLVALAAFVGTGVARAGGAPDFNAYLDPTPALTDVDALVNVAFLVDSTAVHFNAYEITIQFDPNVVEFVSVARGTAMLAACPFNLTFPSTTDSTVTYSHTLICADTFLDGPGELSVFTFRGVADGVSPLTITSNPDCTFFDAGICVSPAHPTFPRQVHLANGAIVVGADPTGVPTSGAASSSGVALAFRPNPTPAGGRFETRGGDVPRRLVITDVTGRRVFSSPWPADVASLDWSGRDGSGETLAAGIYFAVVEGARSRAVQRVVLVR